MDKTESLPVVGAGTTMNASEKGKLETPSTPNNNTITSKAAYHLSSLSTRLATGLTFICLTVAAIHYFAPAATTFPSVNLNFFPWDPPTCPAPKPNVFGYHPPRPSNEEITKATKGLDDWLTRTVSQKPIDSLSIAVVTSAGPLFEKGYGILRANESVEGQNPVDRNSIYRIASVTKMFTVLETLILRERGILQWDDPVKKYLPNFSPPSYGWAGYLNSAADTSSFEPEMVTLHQLASHLAGIGRDYPPLDLPEWPPHGPIEVSRDYMPNVTSMLRDVAKYPLVNLPWSYPIYSNTAMALLGAANVAANKLASTDPDSEPQTHEELVNRDIFKPLGFNGSFFRVPVSSVAKKVAVPKDNSGWADIWLDGINPAGGQYSSLKDLEALMQTLLSPSARGGVVSASAVREWLRPLHVWGATKQEVGAPWEVMNIDNKVQAYTKAGDLPGYHSQFAIFPEYSYGIIVLLTGNYDPSTILTEVTKRLHPALNRIYQTELERRYVGHWLSEDGLGIAEITLDKGKNTLFVKKLIVLGVDALKSVHENGLLRGVRTTGPAQVALWTTGRVGEFRLAFGVPTLNKVPGIGCFPYWLTIDPGLNSRGAPIDLLYWDRGSLVYPSAGVTFSRIR